MTGMSTAEKKRSVHVLRLVYGDPFAPWQFGRAAGGGLQHGGMYRNVWFHASL